MILSGQDLMVRSGVECPCGGSMVRQGKCRGHSPVSRPRVAVEPAHNPSNGHDWYGVYCTQHEAPLSLWFQASGERTWAPSRTLSLPCSRYTL